MILSPVMSYVVDKEVGFPAPSEKEKLERAINRYKNILREFPNRADIGEIKFGLADLLLGRNAPGDYKKAFELYENILKTSGSPYLRARSQIGKAELSVPGAGKEKLGDAIELCGIAARNLGKDLSDFFAAKGLIIEADLRMIRDIGDDHKAAQKLHERLIKDKKANWYFRARAYLGKAELILYHKPGQLGIGIDLARQSSKLLAERPEDYFTLKAKIIEAELRIRRGTRQDFQVAERLCKEAAAAKTDYKDLVARAKLNLADILKNPKAQKMYKEVLEMEGLDPYLLDKVKEIGRKLQAKK